jgi:hypothetical protein
MVLTFQGEPVEQKIGFLLSLISLAMPMMG